MDATVMRLFVAIPVPPEVRRELEICQKRMQSSLPDRSVRWIDPGQFHLTLRFLGNVNSLEVGDLQSALDGVGRRFAPLQLAARGIGFFPDPRRPRVLWAGIVDGSGRLASLQSAIESAVAPFTLERAEARFHGHLTIGRIKAASPGLARALAETAAAHADQRFGDWGAGTIELMRSELSTTGSVHTCETRILLAASSNL